MTFADGRFRMGVGIEDTFIPQSAPGHRSLEEYELTQHYAHWEADLELIARSGATTVRYGLPWYRVNPEPGAFDWDWADRVVDRLAALDLEVILDLVHYGTPLWLDNQFLNGSYPQVIADYAYALADRYGDRLSAWTPLNEPQWTARLCGESATWPPALSGHDGYLRIMLAICRGICLTQHAVTAGSPRPASFVHVEASFRYATGSGVVSAEAELLRERRFLALDLVTGRVDDGHPLREYLARHGVGDDDLAWFQRHAVRPDVLGVNYYPMWSTIEYARTDDGVRGRERDDGAAGLADVLREYSARYDLPVMVTETSFEGSPEEQVAWLRESLDMLDTLRGEVDVVGYVWWPFLDQVKWQYREATDPVENHMHRLGLVSLEADDVGVLHRRPNQVFEAYSDLAHQERHRGGHVRPTTADDARPTATRREVG